MAELRNDGRSGVAESGATNSKWFAQRSALPIVSCAGKRPFRPAESKQLGQADPAITLRVYADEFAARDNADRTRAVIDRVIGGGLT